MVIKTFNNISIVLFLLLLTLLTPGSALTQAEEIVVVHNGLLFTATGEDPIPNGAVVMGNGVIMAVGPEADVDFPDGATVIDAEGGTIMPGIIDARASILINKLKIDDGEIDVVGMNFYLSPTIEAGVTTVRATGWDFKTRPDLSELREALAAHGNTVPTVVFAGFLTHAEGNIFEIYPDDNIGIVTLEEAQQATEDLIQSGADQIGFIQAIPPDRRAENTADLRTGLSVDQQAAVVEIGHEEGLRVLAQTAFVEDAAAAVAAGVDELIVWPGNSEEPLPDELIQALVDNSIPVLTGFTVGAVRPYEGDVRRFIDAGGTVVFGTFAPNSGPISPYGEMNIMSLLGKMTPTEILMAATANAADAVGLGDEIGTLEVGKQADIIIVNGSPFEDHFSVMRKVTTVIKAGEVVIPAKAAE